MTVADLCKTYLEQHAKRHKKTWKGDESRMNHHIIPALGRRKLADVKREDVAALHRRIGDAAPYQANRVVELISSLFEYAMTEGYLSEDHSNPARRVKSLPEQKRDRWVTEQELPRLAKAIDEEGNPYARTAIWLYLLTGLRKNELLNARWDDVNFDRAELRIEDHKTRARTGKPHYVPLSAPALALLRELPRLGDNPYLFPSDRKADAPLYDLRKPWDRIRTKAGVQDVRTHDLRRTVGSWLAQSGNTLHLIGKILNHSNERTTAIYARFGQDHVRAALDQHAEKLMGVAGKREKAPVVNLKR